MTIVKSNSKQTLTSNYSISKNHLLKTPVKIVRISSNYGYRKHPVLGYGKMHKGVDFAGPTGTPIFAAGDGTVIFKGWQRGYGKVFKPYCGRTGYCPGPYHDR